MSWIARMCEQEVGDVADAIRRENHTDLDGAEIAYVFRPKGPTSGGTVRLGKALLQEWGNAPWDEINRRRAGEKDPARPFRECLSRFAKRLKLSEEPPSG